MRTERKEGSRLPLLVQHASPIPLSVSLGTKVVTLVRIEGADGDAGSECDDDQLGWVGQGASFDSKSGVWLKEGRPFVLSEGAALGTRTQTRVRDESGDEDPD